MPRRRSIAAALAALTLTLAGCGDDGPSSTAEGPAAAADGDFPVVIDHAHATTTLDARPTRIVSLNLQWTDALLAMGVEPVAYLVDAGAGETGPYPWQAGRLADAERLDTNGTVPFERIAALEPDLILATWQATDAGVYESLAAIAPTIGLLGELQVDPWADQVEVLGRVLGEAATAEQVVAEVEDEVAAVARALPGLRGRTYVAANYVPGDGIYVVADPQDGASRLFYDLGMEIEPRILALDEQAVGRVQLSLEQAGLLDADFVGILTNGADPSELPGWDQFTSARHGTAVEFELADVVGLNTPTPLSLPYVLDLIRPALARVAALPDA